MKRGAKKPLQRPITLESAARSWEEIRYVWQQISGEDLSRQRIQQIHSEAVHKLRVSLAKDKALVKELWSYLPLLP